MNNNSNTYNKQPVVAVNVAKKPTKSSVVVKKAPVQKQPSKPADENLRIAAKKAPAKFADETPIDGKEAPKKTSLESGKFELYDGLCTKLMILNLLIFSIKSGLQTCIVFLGIPEILLIKKKSTH